MNYQDNAAGVSSITGLDDYVITGTLNQYGPMNGVLVNGQSYAYYAKYANVEDGTDYETGQGVWSGGNTLSRGNITTSSNAGNSVNWGAGQKAIYIVADAELSTDMEQMVEGVTKKILTVSERSNIATMKSKVDLITITQAVDLDTMEAQINAAVGGMRYRGNWDASSGVFPGGGTALLGDFYYCSVSGTVDGNEFTAGDNIVALVNNASISTYAGNWSKHDQTDAVQSVAGETGTVTADELNAAMKILTPFDYKPAGEPIMMLCIGDSNMVGIGGTDGTLTLNPNVWVYSTPGTSAWSAADLDWFNDSTVDPAGPAFPNLPTAPTSFTGVLRSNNGDTGYAAAVRLQERTGRDVYMFHTACAGKTMAYWLPGGGAGKEGMNALIAQLPGAIAAIPAAPDFFDVVIMSDSTNDAGTAVTPETFLTNFTTMYDYMVSQGWIDTRYTRWFQLEAPQVYPAYAAGWLGLQYLSNAYGERVQILSSVDLPVAVDNTHFAPFALQLFGVNAADSTLSGLTPKSLVRPGSYVETLAPVIGADMDCGGFDLLNVDTIAAPAPGDILKFSVENTAAYNMEYNYISAAGLNTTALTMGGQNGAFYFSRMNAGAGYPAHHFLTTNTLTGSSSIAAFSHNGLANAVTISRTGLLHTEGGITTDGEIISVGEIAHTGQFTTDYLSSGIVTSIAPFVAADTFTSATGEFGSSVANGASAIGFEFDTINNFTTSGAKLASWKNATVEKASIDKDGIITCSVISAGSADFNSNLFGYCFTNLPFAAPTGYKNLTANGASAVCHKFDTAVAYTTTAKLVNWSNNTTEKAYINQAGSLGLAGGFRAAYVTKTANYTATVNDFTVEFTSGTNTFTLFKCATDTTGQIIIAINNSGNNLTFATTGGDSITGGVLPDGQTRAYQSNGSSAWRPIFEYS